jgi:hypothetical protein
MAIQEHANSKDEQVSKRTPIIGWSFFVLINIGIYFVVRSIVDAWLGSATVSPDKVGAASTLVMQIDSFLAAGYVIGFFQLQGQVARMIEDIARLKSRNLTLGSHRRSKYFAGRRFFLNMFVIVLFVASGLYAVRGALFGTRDELVSSLALLVLGIAWMVFFWFLVIVDTESMAERIGKRLRSENKDVSKSESGD